MTKPTGGSKNDAGLTGYLLLFLVFNAVSLIFASFDIITNRSFYLLMISVSEDAVIRNAAIAYVGFTVIYIILVSAAIFYFLSKSYAFLKAYVISVVFGVSASVIRLAFFPAIGGIFNSMLSLLGIIFSIVMLFFWVRYFKTAVEAKVYLKTQGTKKDKYERRREKFKVIKKD